MNLKERIKLQAKLLGFDLCSVTDAKPPAGFERFAEWVDQGLHGEMHFLETEKARTLRADLRSLFEPVRSVLVLGVIRPLPLYYPPPKHYLWGRISAYTIGEDYHLSLPPKLHALAAWLQSEIGEHFPYKVYTDAGPILERELAMRSGLGWIGKNGCLINPRCGSSFLLAELLLPIELESDLPFTADYCGSCSRCIQACPTACILPNRTIDAARCLAYLNIEHRGSIPPALRHKLGEWVFGCDICQNVCPWNKHAFNRLTKDQLLDFSELFPNLLDEVQLIPQTFKTKYGHKAISRAKWRGYLRNVIIVIGNQLSKDDSPKHFMPAAIKALAKLLIQSNEPLHRAHAAWSLGLLKSEEAVHGLKSALSNEKDPLVLSEILAALNRTGDIPN